jgi:hypothetical protein
MPKAIPPECSGKSKKRGSAQCDEPTRRNVRQNPPNEYQSENRPEHGAKDEANPKLEPVSRRIKIHGQRTTI